MSNYHQLLNSLEELKLNHIKEVIPHYLDSIDSQERSLVDSMLDLMNKELSFRDKRGLENRIKNARFPYQKEINDFDFDFQPKLNKTEIRDLHSLRFLDTQDNVLFIGNSGVGKSHLSISIGLEGIRKGYSTYFILSNDLIERLLKAYQNGNLDHLLRKYAKYDILIIDEIGYLPMTKLGANLFFQLINQRYERKSTILTSNIPLSQWSEVFQDKKITNAIIDRLIHHSRIIHINGNSYRMKNYMESKNNFSEASK